MRRTIERAFFLSSPIYALMFYILADAPISKRQAFRRTQHIHAFGALFCGWNLNASV